jgi:transcription antitermination factor NusG
LSSKWYALGCKAHKERFLWKQLQAEGYELFFPRISSKGANRRYKPFFPRYLFIRLDLELVGHSKFNNMPYTNGLVSIEGKPFHIPDAIIEAIRKRIIEIEALQKQSGEIQEISENGVMSNIESLLDVRRPEAERMSILTRLFNE